jgi:hypothetical protein
MKRVDDIIMYIIGTFTSQGKPLQIKLQFKYSQRVHTLSGGYYRSGHKTLGILATVWCLAAFVFVNSYNSLLVSYLSVSYKSPDINSLAQLASSSTHKMVTMKGILYEIDILVTKNLNLSGDDGPFYAAFSPFQAATSGPMKVLGDKLLKCPSCRTSTLEEVVPKVLEENGVGILVFFSKLLVTFGHKNMNNVSRAIY